MHLHVAGCNQALNRSKCKRWGEQPPRGPGSRTTPTWPPASTRWCKMDAPMMIHSRFMRVCWSSWTSKYQHLMDIWLIANSVFEYFWLLTLNFNATKHLRSPPVTAAGEWIFRSDPELPGDEGMFDVFAWVFGDLHYSHRSHNPLVVFMCSTKNYIHTSDCSQTPMMSNHVQTLANHIFAW